MQTVKISTSQT